MKIKGIRHQPFEPARERAPTRRGHPDRPDSYRDAYREGIGSGGHWQICTLIICIFLVGCDREYLPKPLGYNRLEIPEPAYRLSPDTLPYRFEYSKYAKLLDDTSAINERYWIEIYYPMLQSNVHITYKQ